MVYFHRRSMKNDVTADAIATHDDRSEIIVEFLFRFKMFKLHPPPLVNRARKTV